MMKCNEIGPRVAAFRLHCQTCEGLLYMRRFAEFVFDLFDYKTAAIMDHYWLTTDCTLLWLPLMLKEKTGLIICPLHSFHIMWL